MNYKEYKLKILNLQILLFKENFVDFNPANERFYPSIYVTSFFSSLYYVTSDWYQR